MTQRKLTRKAHDQVQTDGQDDVDAHHNQHVLDKRINHASHFTSIDNAVSGCHADEPDGNGLPTCFHLRASLNLFWLLVAKQTCWQEQQYDN